MKAKAAPWKHGTISKLNADIAKGGTLAIIDVHGIPAGAMLGMRETLRDTMSIRVAKKKLMSRAWDESNLDTDLLEEMFGNAVQPALVVMSATFSDPSIQYQFDGDVFRCISPIRLAANVLKP